MIERRVVRRYASALYRAASRENVVDRVESDLGLVAYTLESTPRLMAAVWSPLVPAEQKKSIIKGIFEEKVHDITLRYLNLLIDKRREAAMTKTEEEYVLLANEARGIMAAEVTTAVPLSEAEAAKLTSKLSANLGKAVQIKQCVDPSIIGGVMVRIEDKVIDGSVRGQLAALKERMLS